MNYRSRKDWGARLPTRTTPLRTVSNGVVIHHGGNPIPDSADAAAVVRAYQRHHMDQRGWTDIAYSWLVDPRDGTIYEGRGWGVANGATTGYGTSTIAICIIGHGDQLTDAAKRSINDIIAEAEKRHGVKLRVRGHRDFKATACPGDFAYQWVVRGRPVPALPGLKFYFPAGAETKVIKRGGMWNWLPGMVQIIKGIQTVIDVPADGVYGPQTAWRVGEIQHFFGLPFTGVVDAKFWGLVAIGNGGRLR
jgi:hypothetical protein